MNFLQFIISILGEFLNLQYLRFWFFPLLALAFIASVPAIIHSFITWK